ncbi:MAG: tRNA (N(6)-L-threonylcarbamoyladenosine(37)-C(2))-methylthiotransferase MtaB [Flavobacteriales bacterium]
MIGQQKVAFHTLGCKLNFAETSAIARSFADAGYGRVEIEEQPDVVVINTCSVTDQADKKCRHIVRKALNGNPNAFVAVIGCYAQLKPDEIAAIPGVDLVLGANEKFNLPDHVAQLEAKRPSGQVIAGHIKETKDFVPSYSTGDRTRTFLKVQDGCNYFCAFCTIPLARGRSRSASIQETLQQAQNAIADGAKEIVLTGVNIGDFGTANGETLLHLVKALDVLEGVERYRISSIEPNLLSDDIIDFVAGSKKFVPHFHIPLQSGDDEVLKAMRRRYLTDLYKARVEAIRQAMPDACIGVDVIVGFPGETDAHFENTYSFLQELPVSYLHVFTYSERANTTALRIEEVVPMEIRQERNKRLRILSNKKRRAFYESQLGSTRKVLFEASEHEGIMHGFTENYVKVEQPFNAELINQVRHVRLERISPDGNVQIALAEEVAR